MPYKYEWVEPELFLDYKGVKVYHAYKDDDYEMRQSYWFQVQKKADGGTTEDDLCEFDVRDLATWKIEMEGTWKIADGGPKQAIQEIIDKSGRDGLLFYAEDK